MATCPATANPERPPGLFFPAASAFAPAEVRERLSASVNLWFWQNRQKRTDIRTWQNIKTEGSQSLGINTIRRFSKEWRWEKRREEKIIGENIYGCKRLNTTDITLRQHHDMLNISEKSLSFTVKHSQWKSMDQNIYIFTR